MCCITKIQRDLLFRCLVKTNAFLLRGFHHNRNKLGRRNFVQNVLPVCQVWNRLRQTTLTRTHASWSPKAKSGLLCHNHGITSHTAGDEDSADDVLGNKAIMIIARNLARGLFHVVASLLCCYSRFFRSSRQEGECFCVLTGKRRGCRGCTWFSSSEWGVVTCRFPPNFRLLLFTRTALSLNSFVKVDIVLFRVSNYGFRQGSSKTVLSQIGLLWNLTYRTAYKPRVAISVLESTLAH